jgi:hypothetical protein
MYFLKINIYRTIIFPVVLYGCETWSLTLREERRLRVRGIFGPKRDEVTREWRKVHNEVLHDLYYSTNMGKGIGMSRVLVGKPEGKRPLGRPRHKWIFRK